jgi:hypothetical protein
MVDWLTVRFGACPRIAFLSTPRTGVHCTRHTRRLARRFRAWTGTVRPVEWLKLG